MALALALGLVQGQKLELELEGRSEAAQIARCCAATCSMRQPQCHWFAALLKNGERLRKKQPPQKARRLHRRQVPRHAEPVAAVTAPAQRKRQHVLARTRGTTAAQRERLHSQVAQGRPLEAAVLEDEMTETAKEGSAAFATEELTGKKAAVVAGVAVAVVNDGEETAAETASGCCLAVHRGLHSQFDATALPEPQVHSRAWFGRRRRQMDGCH